MYHKNKPAHYCCITLDFGRSRLPAFQSRTSRALSPEATYQPTTLKSEKRSCIRSKYTPEYIIDDLSSKRRAIILHRHLLFEFAWGMFTQKIAEYSISNSSRILISMFNVLPLQIILTTCQTYAASKTDLSETTSYPILCINHVQKRTHGLFSIFPYKLQQTFKHLCTLPEPLR